MQTPLPLPLLLLIMVALAVAAIGTGILLGQRRQRLEQQHLEQERAAREKVARKAAKATKPPVREIDLSQSDVISIRSEIDRCIAQGRWEEGEKWAAHAISTQPNQPDFQLKLAEILCRAGKQREFRAVFEELLRTLPANDERRGKLFALARDIMPDPGPRPPGFDQGP